MLTGFSAYLPTWNVAYGSKPENLKVSRCFPLYPRKLTLQLRFVKLDQLAFQWPIDLWVTAVGSKTRLGR
jgi:hypothetical protein